MTLPSWPDASRPGPNGPEVLVPTGGRASRAVRTSTDTCSSCQRISLRGLVPVRARQAGGLDGVSGCTESVCPHVADGDGLSGGSGGGSSRGSRHLPPVDTTDEAAPYLLGRGEFPAGVGAGASDEGPRAVV